MDCIIEPTNTPSQDTVDHLQQFQDRLIGIEELGKQKEEHTKQLAMYEATVEGRRSMIKGFNGRETDRAEKVVKVMEANLTEHKDLVMRHLKNIKELQSAYGKLILGLLNKADPDWLHYRQKTLLTAFRLAKDIHILIMQKSRDIVLPCKRKRRPVKVYRASRRNRNRKS